jgi:hypothetical protein
MTQHNDRGQPEDLDTRSARTPAGDSSGEVGGSSAGVARTSGTYDPGIPTRAGYRAPDDPLANAGTGRSGPDDVGTQPEDGHGPMLGGLADPSSPMQRLWRHEEGSA